MQTKTAFRFTLGTIAAGMMAFAGAAHADGLTALDSYIKSTKSGSASFTQVVTNTNRANAGAGRQSTGTFSFSRPSHFRFDYTRPYAQTIVADGRNLWMYDSGLNQVTRRGQAQVLDATPAALVASATSIASLQQRFTLENDGNAGNLDWVKATPKSSDGQVRSVRIGFAGKQLRQLEILDAFGQRSQMTFGALQPLSSKTRFTFTPPQGATVLQQ